ncbi:hypothetical protein [Nonomuraea recticatena]|uniref:hypothetical protein n=1 Tax=Nonomuraea recticatena TaxID=46178 RepID=UPI0031F8EEFF
MIRLMVLRSTSANSRQLLLDEAVPFAKLAQPHAELSAQLARRGDAQGDHPVQDLQ